MDGRHDVCSCHAPSASELARMLAENPERLVPRAPTVTALRKALDVQPLPAAAKEEPAAVESAAVEPQ